MLFLISPFILNMKKCNKCNEVKSLNEFYKTPRHKDGLFYHCKSCDKIRRDSIRLTKEYKDKEKEYNLNRNSKPEVRKARKEYQLEYNKKPQVRKKLNDKFKNDINFKFSILLRNHLNRALKNINKSTSVMNLIKMDIDSFKAYIESKFLKGMTWDNWGKVWELDHIKGCCNFDLTKKEEQEACFHFSNYQPLFKTTEIAISFGYKDLVGNRNKPKKN